VKLLIATFFFSFASALVPILNAEIFVAGVAQKYPIVLVALIAAAGQMVGKTLWYYAGAHAEKLPYIHRKMQQPKFETSLDKWRTQTEGRKTYTGLILFASASAGFPPYAVIAALAGVLRVNFTLFLLTGFVGRFLRFWFFAALLDQVLHWFGR
jgi:membrane protein YqaA with SNARE-associated domain